MPRTRKFADLSERIRSDPERSQRIDELIAAYPGEEGAHRIGELRRALEVTQVELAELVGRSQSAISQIENGEIALSVDLLQSIVVQLGAELEIAAVFPDRRVVLEI
jgi:DNA-binding XRE family transcriptional regulator